MKIDEYFDNTNSSDDNEEDSIGEAGRRNEIVRGWYKNDNDDDDVVPVARKESFRALKLSRKESFRALKFAFQIGEF